MEEEFNGQTFDAREWATEFKKRFPENTPDEDTLLGWFANALMAGYDFAKSQNIK